MDVGGERVSAPKSEKSRKQRTKISDRFGSHGLCTQNSDTELAGLLSSTSLQAEHVFGWGKLVCSPSIAVLERTLPCQLPPRLACFSFESSPFLWAPGCPAKCNWKVAFLPLAFSLVSHPFPRSPHLPCPTALQNGSSSLE